MILKNIRNIPFVLITMLMVFEGCNRDPESYTTVFSGNVMTIEYRIIIGEKIPSDKLAQTEKVILHTFQEINDTYNKWNPDSELSRLNRLHAGVIATISSNLERFLQMTDLVVTLTEGRFDPTIEPLQQLWKQHLVLGNIPSAADIDNIVPAIGWDKVHIANGMFYKDHDLTSLDLGGIAKGYCVDLLVERLNALGYANVFVEWGGEIRASGQHPDNRPWKIFISHLGSTNQEEAIAHVELTDMAIATSGDYLQNWHVNEKKYFHIFRPQTYCPLESTDHSIASASVVASSCFLADGLATAAMTFSSPQEAEEWTRKMQTQFPETKFWVVNRNKQQKN